MTLVTYIIRTEKGEYYSGRSDTLVITLQEHRQPKKGWFCVNDRHIFKDVIYFKGDHLKKVKAFGVERFWKIIKNHNKIPLF